MHRTKILIAESRGFPPAALKQLAQAGRVELADLDAAGLARSLADVEVLWVRLRHRIDASLLDRAPRLRMVATPTTGLTHIDLDAVERRGIELVSLRGETAFLNNVRATAEHTIGLILALLRQIPASAEDVRRGNWNRDLFQGSEIFRQTVGVVGYGRLGRIVARYLRALDARVLAADPNVGLDGLEPGVELVPLTSLLRSARIVTVHVNLHESTQHLIGRREFGMMREGCWFVNTSRGEVVDEAALIAALESGRLRGAALDVISGEHVAGSRVVEYARSHSNLLITPHTGGCTRESMEKTEIFLADKVAARLAAESRRATAGAAALNS
jgi:D-3-phosphoglycerate dehydrogenase / 2-oxoglutarate reductase